MQSLPAIHGFFSDNAQRTPGMMVDVDIPRTSGQLVVEEFSVSTSSCWYKMMKEKEK
jgi:hypothetical protein